MKQSARIIAIALAALLIALVPDMTMLLSASGINPISAPLEQRHLYLSVTGTVREINVVTWQTQSWRIATVVDAEGKVTNFVVNEHTAFVTDNELKVGSRVQGFYDANRPMIMIYPPQPTAIAMAVGLTEAQSVNVSYFDQDLLAHDHSLKLNIGAETAVYSYDDTLSVSVSERGSLTIGNLEYRSLDGNAVRLNVAPQIVNGRTFVPLVYFREVLGLNNAYLFEGQVVIDNRERMH